jgi:hypothetical protein
MVSLRLLRRKGWGYALAVHLPLILTALLIVKMDYVEIVEIAGIKKYFK